jgi:hypothetical protein
VTVADEPLSLNFLSLLFGTNTVEQFHEKYADELDSMNVSGLVGVSDWRNLWTSQLCNLYLLVPPILFSTATRSNIAQTTLADETYPAKKGAKKALREENVRRKARGETQKPSGYGFCVASSYLPQVDCFATLQCRNTDFAWLLAATLEGAEYWIADGDPSYNETLGHNERCLVHELRQFIRSDEHVATLRAAGKIEEL